jgi:hypothetical protein
MKPKNKLINNIEIISTVLEDGVLVEVKLKNGFRQAKKYSIIFYDKNSGELVYSDYNVKPGMYSKCTRNDIDLLVKVICRERLIYEKTFLKTKENN